MKTPVLESLFNKVAGRQTPTQKCLPVNIAKFLRTPMFVGMPY